MLIEVEVDTQFGPESAIRLVSDRLDVPAVKMIKVVSATTNYDKPHEEPTEDYRAVNLSKLHRTKDQHEHNEIWRNVRRTMVQRN